MTVATPVPTTAPITTTIPTTSANHSMTKAQVCEHLQLSPRALEMAVRRGAFPPPVRIGKRAYWSRKAVLAWHEALFLRQENWQPDA
ncbi:helix-turn-helix transcriptional regulator [Roseateles sp. BYS78W]|uniref:Helix-turn-helix transcriptional regulator n=1 Tax=Pelomonas candidula TaxID=3299025 RepID=A0ABW7H8Y6_9BURK